MTVWKLRREPAWSGVRPRRRRVTDGDRYADDPVVLCRLKRQAEKARWFVDAVVTGLGLTLSPEKTVATDFRRGFALLGYQITHRSRRMRTRSVEEYKARIRELTVRCCNLDAAAVAQTGAVIRGVARYFATEFATVATQFR